MWYHTEVMDKVQAFILKQIRTRTSGKTEYLCLENTQPKVNEEKKQNDLLLKLSSILGQNRNTEHL